MGSLVVDPKVVELLGLPDSSARDPHALYVAIMHKVGGPIQVVLDRAVKRTGLRSVTIKDAAHPKGAHIDLVTHKGGVYELGVRVAGFVLHSGTAAEVFLDEARLCAVGMPQGSHVKALDAPLDSKVSDTTMAIMAPGIRGNDSRGLFGIDDAILFGVVIPLLIVLIPIVLPLIIQLGGQAIAWIEGAVAGATAPKASATPAPPPATNPIDAAAQKAGIEGAGSGAASKVAIVAALLIVAYVVIRHMKHKAG